VKSTSVSDEDGFAKPESALLELDSSESEESVSLELEVSGPLLHIEWVGLPRVGLGSAGVLRLGLG
jgi:hypothetical protein